MTHTCAVTATGAVKCWGNNSWGQLGDSNTANRPYPVDVSGFTAGGGVSVVAGVRHTCAIDEAGAAQCWGVNWDGELGDGTKTGRLVPVPVIGLAGGVQSLAAGEYHTCAIMTGGAVKCWGSDYSGELGTGTSGGRYPATVPLLAGPVLSVDAGAYHSCAVTGSGGVKCWGKNEYGQLGDTTVDTRFLPVDVSGLAGGVSAVTVGSDHSCALTTAGGVKCWGRFGELLSSFSAVPWEVFSGGIVAVSAGAEHTCALTAAGGVDCWGRGSYGQISVYFEAGSGIKAVAAGGAHTCVLTSVGGVKCWGSNQYGQLGEGPDADAPSPADVYGLTSGVAAIAAGGDHTCALLQGGGVMCWGRNDKGQVGDGTTINRLIPRHVSGLDSGVVAIGLGDFYSCAVTSAGRAKCWGWNSYGGQLGDGTTEDRHTPTDVQGLPGGALSIAGGGCYGYSCDYSGAHTCALVQSGGDIRAKCWGNDSQGQLGIGAGLQPVDVLGFEGDPVTPSPTPTATSTPTPSLTPAPTASPTLTPTPTPETTETPSGRPRVWLPCLYR